MTEMMPVEWAATRHVLSAATRGMGQQQTHVAEPFTARKLIDKFTRLGSISETFGALKAAFSDNPEALELVLQLEALHDRSLLTPFDRSLSAVPPPTARVVYPHPARIDDELKPDPFTAHTLQELEEVMRAYWRWCDCPSPRTIVQRSRGAFSHPTINNILRNKTHKPPLRLSYVQGFVRGCGGSAADEKRWVTAWRKISLSNT